MIDMTIRAGKASPHRGRGRHGEDDRQIHHMVAQWRPWQRIHVAMRNALGRRAGPKTSPSAVITDSQTVKTTDVGGRRRGHTGLNTLNLRNRGAWVY